MTRPAKPYIWSAGRWLPLAGGPAVLPDGPGAQGPGGPPAGNRSAIPRGAASGSLAGTDFPDDDAAFGPLTIRRSYNGEAPGFPASWAASNAGVDVGKRASCWSGKPNIAAMAAGS